MSDPILHFLIVFDHTINELLDIVHFETDIKSALVAYAEKEMEYRGQDFIEIVLLGSDSLESVKATHTNYFPDVPVQSKWLVDL